MCTVSTGSYFGLTLLLIWCAVIPLSTTRWWYAYVVGEGEQLKEEEQNRKFFSTCLLKMICRLPPFSDYRKRQLRVHFIIDIFRQDY